MSTTETDELVKRLRKRAELNAAARGHPVNDDPDVLAADRLVSLQGEVERLTHDNAKLSRAVVDWGAEIKRLKAVEAALTTQVAQVEHLPQPSPAGWKLVPIEPTREHYERYAGDRFTSFRRWSEVYHDMLAAAPSAPPQASESGDGLGEDKSKHGHEG
jgi:hypothetical protein